MLGPEGTPIKEIYEEDNLHMNAKGYSIWRKEIQSHLLR
jgi:lysophospholipase L1-like esterase